MLNHAVLSPSLVTHRPEAETSRTREDRLGITAAGGSAPAPEISRVETIEIEPMGNLGNRMIQYLAARHLQSACPGSRILRANLPELNIEQADEAPDPGGPLFTLRLEPGVDFAAMVERVVAGGYRRVRIADHMQRLDYLPDAATSAKIFPNFDVPFQKTSAHELLIDIRAAEFDQGSGHAPLVPVAFYERLVDLSGLSPVFIGRIGQNAYAQALRHTFPQAMFIDNQDALADFQTIRSAEHIVVSPSSLSWLAARLSQAQQIFVPVIGFLNPMHSTATATDVLPSDDPRYRFFIFPLHYGVPEQQALPYHADLSRLCREISSDQVAFLRRQTPILHVAEPIEDIDARWYCNQYQDAALEIAQGWYAGAAAHYAGIGRQRGYKPMPAGFSYTAQVPAGLVDHALGGAARQSSMSSSSIGATALEDAARAVQGIVQNPYAFHTGWENGPWWDVDLGAVRSITHVVIHNRTEDDGIIGRATPLSASISFDGDIWLPLFVTPDALIFGLQGRKLVWQSPEVVKTRFLRLSVARITCFHLRQVQVFGPP
jgi:hypothetical protein